MKIVIGYIFVHHPVLRELKKVIGINKIEAINFSWIKWGTFEDNIVPHLVSHDISIAKAIGFDEFSVKQARWRHFFGDDIFDRINPLLKKL